MPLETVSHKYDTRNRWTERNVDGDITRFVYDGAQIVLALDGSNQVTDRYLWGPAVDMLLAEEEVTSSSATALWALGDHQNSLRDYVTYDGTTIEDHLIYNAFGAPLSAAAADYLFGFTGRPTDHTTGLQNNLHRWYDSDLHQWLSEDPKGFAAGDANLRRYVSNDPVNKLDPSGLDELEDAQSSLQEMIRAYAPDEHWDADKNQAKRKYVLDIVGNNRSHISLKAIERLRRAGYAEVHAVSPEDMRVNIAVPREDGGFDSLKADFIWPLLDAPHYRQVEYVQRRTMAQGVTEIESLEKDRHEFVMGVRNMQVGAQGVILAIAPSPTTIVELPMAYDQYLATCGEFGTGVRQRTRLNYGVVNSAQMVGVSQESAQWLGDSTEQYVVPVTLAVYPGGGSEVSFKKLKMGGASLWVDELGGVGYPEDVAAARAKLLAPKGISNVPGDDFIPNPSVSQPYSRPSGAGPTAAQRAAVQGKPCVECGKITSKQVADHIDPLSVQHYRDGSVDIAKQSKVEAVQPHCPDCSAKQGGLLSAFSKRMKAFFEW